MFRKVGAKNSDARALPKRKNKTKYMFMACEQREGKNHNIQVRNKSFEYVVNSNIWERN